MRWIMLLILFLVRLSMGFQFQSVATTSTHLVDEFGLSYAELGTLIGLFLLPGVLISIPSGALTRSFADKSLLMFGALAMAIGGYLMGAAADATELYIGRVVTGVGGTIFNVILTKMVTEWFFQREIVLALSVMLTAWPIGIALALLVQGSIAAAHGWQWAMYATAIAALAALALTALFYRAPPSLSNTPNEALRYGLPLRQFVHISVVGIAWTLYNATLILVVSFAPDALVLAGYPPGDARSLTSLFMWTTMISIPLGGRILQTVGFVTTAISVSLLAASVTLVFIADAASPPATFILFGVLSGVPAGALMALSAQAVSRENRGPGLGIFYTWYYSGMTLMPILAGWLRDWSGSAKAPVLFSSTLVAGTVLCVWLLRGLQGAWPIERDRRQPMA